MNSFSPHLHHCSISSSDISVLLLRLEGFTSKLLFHCVPCHSETEYSFIIGVYYWCTKFFYPKTTSLHLMTETKKLEESWPAVFLLYHINNKTANIAEFIQLMTTSNLLQWNHTDMAHHVSHTDSYNIHPQDN